MQHVARRRRPRRTNTTTARRRTISRIARIAERELDCVSIERVGLLLEDGSPGARLAACWEAQALAERNEYSDIVSAATSDVLVCRSVL